MFTKNFSPLAASRFNLRRLLAIRFIVLACQILALAYTWFVLKLSLDYRLIGFSLLVLAIINLAVYLYLRQNQTVSDLTFLAHLLFDVLALSLLLYLSGGASNPFVSYFLVPITISAAILPWRYTWIVAALSLLAYSSLLFFFRPLPGLMPEEINISMEMDSNGPNLHILGMWFNFLVSAVLITYFVAQMANEIRTQANKLSHYREENLRDEQILAVATQAAGTAHELGTPLGTVAVLLTEIEKDYADNPELQKDIVIIKQQVSRCKESLKDLVSQADFKQGNTLKKIPLLDFIQRILEQWQLIRPEVTFAFSCQEQGNAPEILNDSTLQQAIINILDNAADASPEGVETQLSWSNKTWELTIRDHGEGISQEILSKLGTEFVSTKEDGMGVGVLLSQASIQRLGGEITLYKHAVQGTVTKIILPLAYEHVEDISGEF